MPRNPKWSRDELLLALDLYLREGMLDDKHSHVIELSKVLNQLSNNVDHPDSERFRNPNGVAMKLANFASMDPNYPGRALSKWGQGDVQVWTEFQNDRERLQQEAKRIRLKASVAAQSIFEKFAINDSQAPIFSFTPEQLAELIEAIGGWPVIYHETEPLAYESEEIKELRGEYSVKQKGPGFQADAELRFAIEKHAMNIATKHYQEAGWNVIDVSKEASFDLFCTNPSGEEVRVEVKGTTLDGSHVLLTANEVEHARTFYPSVALAIVAGIGTINSEESRIAYGGHLIIIEPWDINVGNLKPLTYVYHP